MPRTLSSGPRPLDAPARRRCAARPVVQPARRLGLGAAATLGLVLLLMAPVRAATAESDGAAQGADSWYAERLSSSERGFNVSYFWSEGRRLRSETVVSGVKVVTIVNGDRYYAVDALHGKGVSIERAPAALEADGEGGRPFATETETILELGGEKVGSEELGGRKCDVLRVTNDWGRREICVTQDGLQLPVHVETFNRRTSHSTSADYLGWLRGIDLPDRFFEPDPRYTLETLTYSEYVERSAAGPVGPVPVLFADLLHGERPSGPPR